jgi:hypothetical protein
MADGVKNKLIPSIKNEISAVSDLTKEYIKLYGSIKNAIRGYEEFAGAIGKTIRKESDGDPSNDIAPN